MSASDWALFLLAAFGAEVVGSMGGFGAATLLTPVAASLMDMRSAVAAVGVFHLWGDLTRVWLFRRHVDRRLALRFGVAGVLFSVLGAALAGGVGSSRLKAGFGAFLLLYVLLALFGRRPRLAAGPATAYAGGAGAGLVSGLIGTGGAVRSSFLLCFDLEKNRYLGTSALIALMVDAARVPVYLAQGLLSREWICGAAGLLVAAVAGAHAGKALVGKIPPRRFAPFVLALLGLVGVRFLWDGLK